MKKLLVVLMVTAMALLVINCQKKAKVEETPAPVDTTAVVDTVQA